MTFLLGKKVPVKITFGQYNLKVIKKILSLGFSPFLILATDSLILIFMNTVLQKYGGASQGDMLITCATIAQSYLLLITSPIYNIFFIILYACSSANISFCSRVEFLDFSVKSQSEFKICAYSFIQCRWSCAYQWHISF